MLRSFVLLVAPSKISLTGIPPYQTRISARAKHLQVKVCAPHGLEVVIPTHLRDVDVEAFLQSKYAWLQRHAELIERNRHDDITLPTSIDLLALSQTWQLDHQHSTSKPRLIERPAYQLVMVSNTQDIAPRVQCLKAWLRLQAKQQLIPRLDELSRECKLPYSNVGIRAQSTRWGSCSTDNTIQLNMQLLFLPEDVMRYVLIHELCHTVHLNHSQRFWALVKRFDPGHLEHRKLLRDSEHYIPRWVKL